MNDINENKVPEEVRLKIEKLEKNVDNYNAFSTASAVNVAASVLVMIVSFLRQSQVSNLSFGITLTLLGLNLAFSVKSTAKYMSKKNIAEHDIEELKEQYGNESERNSPKKRIRGR